MNLPPARSYCASILLFASAMSAVAATAVAQTELKGLGTTGKVELIQDGFEFLEGPAKAPDGSVYFTDIPAESIYRMTPDEKIELFCMPSGHANGLMFGGGNRLLACQMDGQLVSLDLTSKKLTTIAGTFDGSRFNACNDLVIDKLGGIYFTDPHFRAPDPLPQGKTAFYYVSAKGKVSRLGDDLKAPNGISLSPDEKRLYVIPSMQAEMMAYDVQSPGKLGEGRVLCRLAQAEGESNGGGDGMAVDVQGNLYITTHLGIQVFDSAGKALGIIKVPEIPANCNFAGSDHKTLIITARTGLYRCQMPVEGHLFRK